MKNVHEAVALLACVIDMHFNYFYISLLMLETCILIIFISPCLCYRHAF